MTIRQTGWALSILKFSTDPVAHSALTGHWLNIYNTEIGNGNILRISNLGVYTISNANNCLGIGLNQHGVVKPMKGGADWKFNDNSLLCEIEFEKRKFKLFICNDGEALRLKENDSLVLALDSNGLWRYGGYHGYAHTDTSGRIAILRTGFNVNK